MARPNRLNYATGPEGLARFKKALNVWQDKQKALKAKAEAKKPAPKKPVAKKPVAKKPATKRPGMTKAEKQEMLKGNSIQDKEKALKTKTKTKKPVAKKPVAKKPVAKKPVAKKPVAKKPVAKKPAPKKTANNLKIKKAANTAVKTTKTAIKKATPVVKKAAKTVAKKAGEAKQAVDKKVSGIKKAFKKKAPKPTTPAQKAVSKVYQGSKNLIKKGVTKGLPKVGKAIGKNLKSSTKGGVAGIGTALLASAINTRMDRAFAKRAGMSLQEYQANKKKVRDSQRIIPTATRTVKGIAKRLRGNSGESSTTRNLNKQKEANKLRIKGKKTERSSRKNTNKDYNAPTATKKADKRFSTFRVDPEENLKLQKERKAGNTETYSRKLSPQAKKTKSNNTTTSNAPKPGSARAKLRAKNEARFGKARVDKLRAKNKDFQAMKKKKMTKAEFIRRYPNSITAQKAKGLRK